MKSTAKNTQPIFALIFAFTYLALGYAVPRSDFPVLLTLFALLFAGYFYFLRSDLPLKTGLTLALVFRLLLLFSLPTLSDDYFRFLWDGRLLIAGENPFLNLPDLYANNNFSGIPGLSRSLYENLNSPHYFSVYPPVCQFVFGLTAFIDPKNNLVGVIVMRFFILLAETGSVWLLLKLLRKFNLPEKNIMLYALNPLVIMELTGNLHFEAFMIFFTLAALYFFTQNRYHFSAVSLGLAVCSKLLPLIILPFLFKRLGLRNWLSYCLIVCSICLVLFLPFLNAAFIAHFSNSLNLYFQKFEFNASIYYLIREIGFLISGYNQIAIIGPMLSLCTFCGVLLLAARETNPCSENLPKQFIFALTLYLLFATIVHPWYLTTLVAFATLTNLRYPIIWAGLGILSYAAYQTNAYTENPLLLTLEYLGLATAFLLEKRYPFAAKKLAVVETKNL
jgi:alpha-1,6-mannosyltransferase